MNQPADSPASVADADCLDQAAAYLAQRLGGFTARIAIVLGSGLGAFAERLRNTTILPYAEIPHFPVSGVVGHAGRLVAGELNGVPVLVMQGRVHAYEGHSADAVVFAVRVLAAIGVKVMILTNAAGGIRLDLRQGQLVLISDHINLSGLNPAVGPLRGERPRFFDMSEAYSRPLRQLAHAAAAANGSYISEGVYISVLGPSFETPAEIRAFRMWGADLVGMSTTLETIAARQAGVEVLGISCVTNMAAGVDAHPLSHEEVMETGRGVEQQLTALLNGIVPRAAAYLERPPETNLLAQFEPSPGSDEEALDTLDRFDNGDED
ncbi:purine-nucleoside phosphorylase [Acidipila sp. EB88]|uniref:purine-nucleoside phosphorylase n=1 Tax=Acidipila sp. EB88 TaxID=2305226 RepID=UPI000F5D916D|nr:purine-nucleoside phosphorylase [Acidipila sp. EB88]RRA48745.1 purine-nucleoside phosphorylase [Acidipila sp. EB88]